MPTVGNDVVVPSAVVLRFFNFFPDDAKTTKLMALKAEAKGRAEKKLSHEQMEEVRLEALRKRDMVRMSKELLRIDDLKQELEEELDYKAECIGIIFPRGRTRCWGSFGVVLDHGHCVVVVVVLVVW